MIVEQMPSQICALCRQFHLELTLTHQKDMHTDRTLLGKQVVFTFVPSSWAEDFLYTHTRTHTGSMMAGCDRECCMYGMTEWA